MPVDPSESSIEEKGRPSRLRPLIVVFDGLISLGLGPRQMAAHGSTGLPEYSGELQKAPATGASELVTGGRAPMGLVFR